MTTPQRCRLLLGLLLMGGLVHAPSLQAEELYKLDTTCRTGKAQPSACTVTATNVDDTTEYSHSFGGRSVTYRVIDSPYVRIEGRQRHRTTGKTSHQQHCGGVVFDLATARGK